MKQLQNFSGVTDVVVKRRMEERVIPGRGSEKVIHR